FEARIEDRLRQWKLSNMDLPSRERWYDYSRARDTMLEATDTDFAPWYIVRSDDKKRARLNVLSHFLSLIPYEAAKRHKIKLPARDIKLTARDNKNAYDDESTIKNRRWKRRNYKVARCQACEACSTGEEKDGCRSARTSGRRCCPIEAGSSVRRRHRCTSNKNHRNGGWRGHR